MGAWRSWIERHKGAGAPGEESSSYIRLERISIELQDIVLSMSVIKEGTLSCVENIMLAQSSLVTRLDTRLLHGRSSENSKSIDSGLDT